ncbi:MAG: hypothetical protein EXR07_16495 [Acetobacteraceae bacterium]|nr:hypothetical protein [Acetobacteraceae bacterium]
MRRTERFASTSTVEDEEFTAASVEFEERSAYGMVGPRTTIVLNPVTFNFMARIVDSKFEVKSTPDSGGFAWPLWVGKSWDPIYASNDFKLGRLWPQLGTHRRVAAYEDVTVPAGTFKAFRLEITPGITTVRSFPNEPFRSV